MNAFSLDCSQDLLTRKKSFWIENLSLTYVQSGLVKHVIKTLYCINFQMDFSNDNFHKESALCEVAKGVP